MLLKDHVSLNAAECNWILLGGIEDCSMPITGYWMVLKIIEWYWRLLNGIGDYWMVLKIIECYWRLLNAYYWLLNACYWLLISIEDYWMLMGCDGNEYYWMAWLVLGVAEHMCNVYLLNDNGC
jgi:hypothetical protein